jgi:hypothetical protein
MFVFAQRMAAAFRRTANFFQHDAILAILLAARSGLCWTVLD